MRAAQSLLAAPPGWQRRPGAARAHPADEGRAFASAVGNRAMARLAQGECRTLARWRFHPGGKFDLKRGPNKEWQENDKEPVGIAFGKHAGQWYRWTGGKWAESDSPAQEAEKARKPPEKAPEKAPPEKKKPRERPPFSWEKSLDKLPDMALAAALRQLPLDEVRELRTINKRWERIGSSVLRERLAPLFVKTALSSLDGRLKDALRDKLAELAPDQLVVLSDQITPSIVEELTQNAMTKKAVYNPPRSRAPARYASGIRTAVHPGEHKQAPVGEKHGELTYKPEVHGPNPGQKSSKMHVKSMVGSTAGKPQFLETGSANLTTSAMTSNTESVVVLEAPGIAKMFEEYTGDVTAHKRKKDDPDFAKRLEGFNKHNPAGIRAALAPFVNVGEQLTTELKGADKVVVRMFLVSEAQTGPTNQPVEALCALAKSGVDVRVTVDAGQAKEQDYVNKALVKLRDAGVKVSTETGVRGGIMHDKLVFAHYPAQQRPNVKALHTPERWTVMIGSSGLTRNVINDENYENLLIIDDEKLYKELMKHDDVAAANRTEGVPAYAPSPRT